MGLEMIKVFRKEKGLTLEDLSEKSGVPVSTIKKISAGITTDPNLSTVKAIASALGCTLDDFSDSTPFGNSVTTKELKLIKKYRSIDEHGQKAVDMILDHEYSRCAAAPVSNPVVTPAPIPIPLPETVEEPEEEADLFYNVIPIRRSEQPASAGSGAYLGPEAFETILVMENELTRRALFSVPVSGDSMEPLYEDKDILIVERSEDLEPGEIGIFTLNGKGYVKKLGCGQLLSLNPGYPPIPLDDSVLLNGRVIGVLEPEWIVG